MANVCSNIPSKTCINLQSYFVYSVRFISSGFVNIFYEMRSTLSEARFTLQSRSPYVFRVRAISTKGRDTNRRSTQGSGNRSKIYLRVPTVSRWFLFRPFVRVKLWFRGHDHYLSFITTIELHYIKSSEYSCQIKLETITWKKSITSNAYLEIYRDA